MFADVICLANARKRSERCVACVHAENGAWMRLVSRAEHGELSYAHRNLGAGGEPQKLDLMRVRLACRKPTPSQPENWLIESAPWELLERPARISVLQILAKTVHSQELLFGSASDRICAVSFAAKPAAASLALVMPGEVRWLFETIGSKQRVRAKFRLGRCSYNLSVTDPPVEEKLKSLANGEHRSEEIGLRDERLLFCISLGEMFTDGNCYKLVAGVLELPGLAARSS